MARILKPGVNPEMQLSISEDVQQTVRGIIADLRARGDTALRELSQKFDNFNPESFRLNQGQIDAAIAEKISRGKWRNCPARRNWPPGFPGAR